MIVRLLPALCLLLVAPIRAQDTSTFQSAAEASMVQAWIETGALDRPLAHAVLVAEDAASMSSLDSFDQHLDALFADLDRRVRGRDDDRRKLRTIWRHLQGEVFEQHQAAATLSGLFQDGFYSSTTGSLLFLLAAERYGIPVTLYETPVHFYIAGDGGSHLIDVTDPRRGLGFDDPRRVHQHLTDIGLLSQEDTALGAETVYTQVIREAKPVPTTRLVAHAYAMRMWATLDGSVLDEAIALVEKAWRFAEGDEAYGQMHAMLLGQAASAYGHDAERFVPYLLSAMDVRAGDSTFLDQMMPLMLATPQQLARDRDFDLAIEVVDRAREAFALSSEQSAELDYIAALVTHDKAASFLNRGDIEAAHEAASQARALASGEMRIEETYIMTACRLALWRAERGDTERALDGMTAVLGHAEAYPIVRETYARVTMFALRHPNEDLRLHKDEPEEALRLLLQAHDVAPDAAFLGDAIGWAYHEMAMERVRAGDYVTARSYVDSALEYAPGSTFIQEDYELIDQFEADNW